MKSDFRIIKLSENIQLKPFDCGDNDLNNFLIEDALYYKQRLLSITVDALRRALPFYLKNGFEYLRKEDESEESDETVLLFYDLYQLTV